MAGGLRPARRLADAGAPARDRRGLAVFRLYLGCRYDYVHPVMDKRRFGEAASLTPGGILATVARYLRRPRRPRARDHNSYRLFVRGLRRRPGRYQLAASVVRTRREAGQRNRSPRSPNGSTHAMGIGKRPSSWRTTRRTKSSSISPTIRGSIELAAANLRAWLGARQAAVTAARAHATQSQLIPPNPIYRRRSIAGLRHGPRAGGLAHSLVQSAIGCGRRHLPQGSPAGGVNALAHILPEIEFDLVSYSSYESTNSPVSNARPRHHRRPRPASACCAISTASAKRRAARSARRGAGNSTIRFVMIGELGYSRDRFEHLETGGVKPRLRASLAAALDWGCPYIVLWQVFDAPRSGGAAWDSAFTNRRGQPPAIHAAPGSCSTLRDCMKTLFESGLDAW